jgi:hypothetical protein
MDLDVHGAPAHGLRRYLTLVAQLVGAGAEACSIQFDSPIGAYIAVDQRLSGFPRRDVALLWDEAYGWALAIETHSGADLMVLGYLRRAVTGGGAGLPTPPDLRSRDNLPGRLATYAEQVTVGVI